MAMPNRFYDLPEDLIEYVLYTRAAMCIQSYASSRRLLRHMVQFAYQWHGCDTWSLLEPLSCVLTGFERGYKDELYRIGEELCHRSMWRRLAWVEFDRDVRVELAYDSIARKFDLPSLDEFELLAYISD